MKNNSALSVGVFTSSWVKRGPITSSFNRPIAWQGQIYHHMRVLMPAIQLTPMIISVYNFDSDYNAQLHQSTRSVHVLDIKLIEQQAERLHQENWNVHSFKRVWEWLLGEQTRTPYEMTTHADRRPKTEQVERCNVPACIEVDSIVIGIEDGECGWRDIALHRRRKFNAIGNEILNFIPVSNHFYNPLALCFLSQMVLTDGINSEHLVQTPGASRNKISRSTFYSWYLFQGENELSCHLRSCRFTQ